MKLREELFYFFKRKKDVVMGKKELAYIFDKDVRTITKQLKLMEENGEIRIKTSCVNGAHGTNRYIFKGGMINGKI